MRKKLIEVALPLESIGFESIRDSRLRLGHQTYSGERESYVPKGVASLGEFDKRKGRRPEADGGGASARRANQKSESRGRILPAYDLLPAHPLRHV